MTIVMTGGGSGGHITPLLAVASEVKKLRPDCSIVYIGQRGDALGDIPKSHPSIDVAHVIWAGKLRRYHTEGWRQLLDVQTVLLNTRDVFRVLAGLWQSYWLLRKIRPDVMFVKGGFVGVPVGLSAALLRIPYITHDSDAMPGLANRIIAKWAAKHAVGLPKEFYAYPAEKTVTVGVPISAGFAPVSPEAMQEYRKDLGLEQAKQIVFIVGGGLGAQRVNNAFIAGSRELLERYPDLYVLHVVGRANYHEAEALYTQALDENARRRLVIKDFVTELYRYSGAADVVVTRAGATNIAEFAAQAKACVVVPNPLLAGGHQLKNAEAYGAQGAAVIVHDADLKQHPELLLDAITSLLDDSARREALGKALHRLARPSAANDLANLILDLAK